MEGQGTRLLLPPAVEEAMVAHGKREGLREACGLLGGRKKGTLWLAEVYRETMNLSPLLGRYRMDPLEVLRFSHSMETEGRAWLAIVHTHPQGPPLPSETDGAEAFYPDVLYVIVGFWPTIDIRAYQTDGVAWRRIPIQRGR